MYKIITDTFINYMKGSFKKSQFKYRTEKQLNEFFYMQHKNNFKNMAKNYKKNKQDLSNVSFL